MKRYKLEQANRQTMQCCYNIYVVASESKLWAARMKRKRCRLSTATSANAKAA